MTMVCGSTDTICQKAFRPWIGCQLDMTVYVEARDGEIRCMGLDGMKRG